jgi:hypothetical protein
VPLLLNRVQIMVVMCKLQFTQRKLFLTKSQCVTAYVLIVRHVLSFYGSRMIKYCEMRFMACHLYKRIGCLEEGKG